MGYLEGFGVTIRQHRLFGGKRMTKQYSGGRGARKRSRVPKRGAAPSGRAGVLDADVHIDEKSVKPERLHGRHVLNRYEDGMEKCIGCELCAGVCPAKCIFVRGADNDPEHPTAPGERYGYVYEINYLRCIHCDLCVEACPTEAITESKLFEFSFTNRRDAIYTKAELLVDEEGRPQRLPWEDWREGEDTHTSGWMRATSPSGDADFEGIVGWSAELGFGVRDPEPPQPAADSQVGGGVRTVGRRAERSASDPARKASATRRTRATAGSESSNSAQPSERVPSERGH